MKIEVYVPDYEIDVINKILYLKSKRKLSQEVVNLLKGCSNLTEDRVIALIKQYACSSVRSNKSLQQNNDLAILDSIKSVMGELK